MPTTSVSGRRVAVLLDDAGNDYQQLLLNEARTAAARNGVEILEPLFGHGSSWAQVECLNRYLRETLPDGLLIVLAGGQWTRAPFERVVRAGLPVVLLNRIPDWIEPLRRDHPGALIAAVAPDQRGIGAIQAQQALHLVERGAFVLLVTGDAASAAAAARRQGFLEAVGDRLKVHELDGRWSEKGAVKVLEEWFRLGAERARKVDLVVCHNELMAAGARAALAKQAAATGQPALARTPIVGCDGTATGKEMVARGEIAATVVMPPTTPAAIEILVRHWSSPVPCGTLLLEAASHPPLASLRRRGSDPVVVTTGAA